MKEHLQEHFVKLQPDKKRLEQIDWVKRKLAEKVARQEEEKRRNELDGAAGSDLHPNMSSGEGQGGD